MKIEKKKLEEEILQALVKSIKLPPCYLLLCRKVPLFSKTLMNRLCLRNINQGWNYFSTAGIKLQKNGKPHSRFLGNPGTVVRQRKNNVLTTWVWWMWLARVSFTYVVAILSAQHKSHFLISQIFCNHYMVI